MFVLHTTNIGSERVKYLGTGRTRREDQGLGYLSSAQHCQVHGHSQDGALPAPHSNQQTSNTRSPGKDAGGNRKVVYDECSTTDMQKTEVFNR